MNSIFKILAVFGILYLIIISYYIAIAIASYFFNPYEDMSRLTVLADALAVENGAKLYCAQTECEDNQELSWIQISPYVEGLNESYYEIDTTPELIIATKTASGWVIRMERAGIDSGEYEFDDARDGLIPSAADTDRNDVTEDTD